MAIVRPTTNVYNLEGKKTDTEVKIPEVFKCPIRNDLIQIIHKNISKNKRHPYAVKYEAGYETSAESWGTGRAVSRIPRVAGGGTHRAGQAAFGNMCRGGGMFNPTKIWRRWGRKVNIKEKRYSICSAIASSGVTSLVMARGHRINKIKEIPLVICDELQNIKKSKEALKFLYNIGLKDEVKRIIKSKKIRAGKGKMRNRKYKIAKGPLIIYNEDNGIKKSFRNIMGVDLCNVKKLNLLKLAPGGSIGRFIIWTESAFKLLDAIYGKEYIKNITKRNYILPRCLLNNADIFRLIRSDNIQSVLLSKKEGSKKRKQYKNGLTNYAVRCRLNPAYKMIRMSSILKMKKAIKDKKQLRKEKKVKKKEIYKVNKSYFQNIEKALRRKKRKETSKAKKKKTQNIIVAE